ncbi:electron transfer flavoprotein [Desulfitobacterium chlororespirans]|uniref:Electron transfer flavoprotein small subunit n=1 Tax=Desulfitobacterium chlororespirans DSM 11544 TaxID=1121395 RepID=A0A1M7UZC1_9FIRM|nr:electron transfer flavoprotein [Desulfitobacterium chlororespirans]SHN88285.1 electron transfer flavoprotein beta subunit [Desulfitobacterium chlororespirans DSM 11544]
MNIIVCYKIVPEEQDIVIEKDRSLSFARAEWKIGQYDLNAVEAGMQIVESVGGQLTALSIGDSQLKDSKLRKGILSRGPEELYQVIDDQLGNADSNLTARALAAAIGKKGQFDLVLCGEGSSDLYAQQVGAQLGELLDVAVITAVSKITLSGDKIIVERTLESEIEVLEVSLPAVISVTTDINLPRIPQMKSILAASKKPVTEWSLADIGMTGAARRTEIVSTLAPEQVDRKKSILEGDSEEIVEKLFDSIRKELL